MTRQKISNWGFTMNRKKIAQVLLLAMLSLSFTGCIGVNGSFKKIRNTLKNNLDLEYNKTVEFSIGRTGIMLAGMVVRFADTEEPIEDVLREVTRVQVGIYERDYGDLNAKVENLNVLTAEMENQGWKYIVRSVQSNEMVSVFIREDDPEFNQLYVVNVSDHEMVLVEIHGDLSKVIEIVLREKAFDVDFASK
jgi:hypothetical protein